MLFHRHRLLEGLHERAIGFGLIEIGNGSGAIDLCTAGGIRRRQWLLTSPVLDNLAVLEAEQVERDQRRTTFETSYFECTNTRLPSINVR